MSDSYLSAYESPFRAGFGVDPPYLAGRGELFHRILAAIEAGPRRPDFLQLILGGRGVGKTVMLNQARTAVHDNGGVTTTWTAGVSTALKDRLADDFDHVMSDLRAGRPGRITGGSAGLNVGVARADITVAADRTPRPTTVPGMLTAIGREAQQRNRRFVLLVDELQAIAATDAHALSTSLQETNAQGLPIALVAAGLPSAIARLRSMPGATFLERQPVTTVGNLADADVRLALEEPLHDSGRDFDERIIAVMVAFAEGYPYAVQLVGNEAWLAAGDRPRIELVDAHSGSAAARRQLDEIYAGRWSQLADGQRRYLAAVVDATGPDGSALSSHIAARLGGTTQEYSVTREALIVKHQLLYSDERNSLRIALPGLAQWVRRHHLGRSHEYPQKGGGERRPEPEIS